MVDKSPWLAFGGAHISIRMDAAGTDGRYALVESRKPAGSATPVHEHESDRETVYVLEGELCAQTREGLRALHAGDAATLVQAAPHRLANLSDGEVHYLLICQPAGFETLMRECGEPIADPASPSPAMSDAQIARLEAAAARHRLRLLPPDTLPPLAGAPRIAPATRPESFDLIGIGIDVLEQWGDAPADLALLRAVFQPGTIVPLHSHREPEMFYILSGSLDIYRQGADPAWSVAGEGDLIDVPAETRHAIRNASAAPCTVLTLTQRRLLDFFRQSARPAGSPKGPPSPQEVRALFEIGGRFGYWNGSPADNHAIGLAL